jgi:hypothetical protein
MIEREKALSSQNQQVEKKKDIVLPEFSRIGDMPSNLNKTPGWKLIKVSSDQLEYGDIIFLKGKTKTDRFVTHIAIAMSVDQIFHSSRDTKGGCIESLKSLFSKYQIHSRTTPLMENVDSRSNFMSASFVSTFLSPDYMPKPVPLRSPSPLNISGFQAFCNSSPQVKDLFALSQKRAFFSVTNSSSSSSVFDSPPSEASSGSASSPSEGSSGSASPPSEGSSGSVSPPSEGSSGSASSPSEGSSGSASPPSEGSSVTSSSPSFLDRSSWSETKTNSPTELSPSGSAYQSKENSPTRILPTFSGHLPSFPALLA